MPVEITPDVLVVDDDTEVCEIVSHLLSKRGYSVTTAHSGAEAEKLFRDQAWACVVLDVHLGDVNGAELCARFREYRPGVSILMVTGQSDVETAVSALRAGAYDYIAKPIAGEVLLAAVGRATEKWRLTEELRQIRAQSSPQAAIIGQAPAISKALELVDRVADSDVTVLITGESGTGKELFAKALHERGRRSGAGFIAINCAAMPASLLESELFGHTKGAFTDAKKSKPGLFLQAQGGTLFLDEVGEMPLEMQVKLLRVLQERKVRPVGGEQEVEFSARLVTATNRDLQTEVEEGRFRADLFYRINVVHIEVPPLRSRQSDILTLALYFLQRHAARNGKDVQGVSAEAAKRLMDYDWPGNVRELENTMERAVALTRQPEIAIEDLPDALRNFQSTSLVVSGANPEEMVTLEEVEKRYVRRVMAACGGNKSQAARILGIDRRSLYRRLEGLVEPR